MKWERPSAVESLGTIMRTTVTAALIGILSVVSIQVVGDDTRLKIDTLPPQSLESLRPWLFADMSLAELEKNSSQVEPWVSFHKAFVASQHDDAATARRELTTITKSSETRVQLLAWNALRGLGVRPDAKEAAIIRGVIAELHNEGGVGVVAAYDDGRARFLGGTSGGVIWESPGTDAEISRLIRAFLVAAEPIVHTLRPMSRHNATPVAMNYVRVTVLTFGGTYVADAYGPELDEHSQVTPSLIASTELLRALTRKRAAGK